MHIVTNKSSNILKYIKGIIFRKIFLTILNYVKTLIFLNANTFRNIEWHPKQTK